MEIALWPWSRLLLGFGFSAIIAGLGYWRKSLAPGGILGALIIGTLTFGLGWLGLGLARDRLLPVFQPAIPLPRRPETPSGGKILEGKPTRSGAGAGEWRRRGGAGRRLLRLILRPGYVRRVRGRDGCCQRGHLGHRTGRSVPRPAPHGDDLEAGARWRIGSQYPSCGTLASLGGGLFIGLCAWAFGRLMPPAAS